MPYVGDSPVDAWEFWFDEKPSDAVVLCLIQRVKTYSTDAVLEAIEITGARAQVIADETARLQYLSGVLRRKELEAILPDAAAEERVIDLVRKCWTTKRHFTFPLSRKQAREWLSFASAQDLCALIEISHGWMSLKQFLEAVRLGMPVADIKALYRHAETWGEFLSLLSEVIESRSRS